MKDLLIDTNFLIYCVKQKIDLFEHASLNGFKVIVPDEVIKELDKFEVSKKTGLGRYAKLVKRILSISDFEKVSLGKSYVDKGIVNYLKDKPEVILATLDEGLQKKVKNSIMIIRQKKKLEIVNR